MRYFIILVFNFEVFNVFFFLRNVFSLKNILVYFVSSLGSIRSEVKDILHIILFFTYIVQQIVLI